MKLPKQTQSAHPAPTAADRSFRSTLEPRKLPAREAFRSSGHAPRSTLRLGFTILEMLVATAVLVVMVSILFSLFAQGSLAWRYGERQADINQATRLALGMIAGDAALAVIETNTVGNIQLSPSKMDGLKVVIRRTPSGGNPSPAQRTSHGWCDDLFFVAPTKIGNRMKSDFSPYRELCGIRYYVAEAKKADNGVSDLGTLMRSVYRPLLKSPAPYEIYESPWWNSGSTASNAVIAENVLTFRVQPMELDTTRMGLKLANPSMFESLSADQSYEIATKGDYMTINWPGIGNTAMLRYPALIIGLCVVDRQLADRINQIGLKAVASHRDFVTITNWTTVYFQNSYK